MYQKLDLIKYYYNNTNICHYYYIQTSFQVLDVSKFQIVMQLLNS